MNNENNPFKPRKEHLRPLSTHLSPLRARPSNNQQPPRSSPFRRSAPLKSKYLVPTDYTKTSPTIDQQDNTNETKEETNKQESKECDVLLQQTPEAFDMQREIDPTTTDPTVDNQIIFIPTNTEEIEDIQDFENTTEMESCNPYDQFIDIEQQPDLNQPISSSATITSTESKSKDIYALNDDPDQETKTMVQEQDPPISRRATPDKQELIRQNAILLQQKCQTCTYSTFTQTKTCVTLTCKKCKQIECNMRLPFCILLCCPASVLFCCIKEDAPDFPHVNAWVEEDNKRKIYCKTMQRYYKQAKRSAWVWFRQTCCSEQVDEQLKSKEQIKFEQNKFNKLEEKKQKRMSRVSMMMMPDGPTDENFKPARFRAPPRRSTRTLLSAYQLAIMAKENGSGKEMALENDRFGMVRTALNDKCYTVDGKRFFKSRRRLDRHFRDNKLKTKEEVQIKKIRKALTLLDNVPLENRNVRELYAERTHTTDYKEEQVKKVRVQSYDSEASNALKALQKKSKTAVETEEDGVVVGKNVNFTDLQEKRIQNFTKSLLIYDELFRPDLLWSYLDTYDTGTDIRNHALINENDIIEKKPEEEVSIDWLCSNCNFSNLLEVTVCDVCGEGRVEDEMDDDLATNISTAAWFVEDALKIPFRPIIEMLTSCEDQRNGNATQTMPWSDRDLFVDMSRSNNGELAYAVCVFFEFGRVVSMTSSKAISQKNQQIWDNNKSKVALRKKPPPSKVKIVNGRKIKKKKKKNQRKKTPVSCWFQVSSFFEYTKYSDMSVGVLNLSSLPELGYVKYPVESKQWRPTLEETCSILEDRLVECELGCYFIVVTKEVSGKVVLMGWEKVEEIRYRREEFDVVMELFVRDDGEDEEEEEGLTVLSGHDFG